MSHRSALTVAQEGGKGFIRAEGPQHSWQAGRCGLDPGLQGLAHQSPGAPHCTLPRRPVSGSLLPRQGVGTKPTPTLGTLQWALTPGQEDAPQSPAGAGPSPGAGPGGSAPLNPAQGLRCWAGPPCLSSPPGLVGVSPSLQLWGSELTSSPRKGVRHRILHFKHAKGLDVLVSWCEWPLPSAGIVRVTSKWLLVPLACWG